MRFGIIGSNVITERFLQAARKSSRFELAAQYSRDIKKAEKLSEERNVRYAFDKIEDLCKCKDIDAVYIASPTMCHAEQSIQVMKAGKHVICEKPLASNMEEAEKMFQTAEENNVVLMEAMRPVHNPAYNIIKEKMMSLGKIRQVHFSYCQYSSRYNKFKKGIIENAFKREMSNGSLMDLGCYCIETMIMLFGMPQSIQTEATMLPDSIDGQGIMLLKYNDFLGQINYSKISDSMQLNEIQGENGALCFKDITNPRDIVICHKGQDNESIKQNEVEENDMYYEINEFMDAVDRKTISEEYKRYTLETMQILDMARKQISLEFPADKRKI